MIIFTCGKRHGFCGQATIFPTLLSGSFTYVYIQGYDDISHAYMVRLIRTAVNPRGGHSLELPAQYFIVLSHNMFLATIRDVAAAQMYASLSGDPDAIDHSSCVIELCAVILKPAFDRPPCGGYTSVGSLNELHALRHEGQQIVPAVVRVLLAPVRHTTSRRQRKVRRNLARVHGILHERRADEHGRATVAIREWGSARLVETWELGSLRAQRNAEPGKWHLIDI